MRIRTVKPGMWENEELASVSAEAALLAIGLLNYADDEGFFKAHPKLIEAAIFPLRELSSSVRRLLDELSDIGFLALYTGTDGKEYGEILNFTKHQRVDRAKPSEIKGLVKFDDESTTPQRDVPVGMEGNGREVCAEQAPAPTVVIELPTNKRDEFFEVLESDVSRWVEDYPNVSVIGELRKMRSWLEANRTKRKTKGGMPRFIVSWLSREQDKPSGLGAPQVSASLEELAR